MALNRYRQAVATRRLYEWERLVVDVHPKLDKPLPMDRLRALARRAWALEGRDPAKFPRIVAGRGMNCGNGGLVSYFFTLIDGTEPRIVLARHQRRVGIMCHELAHAMQGYRGYDHGPAFVERYLRLLQWCGL